MITFLTLALEFEPARPAFCRLCGRGLGLLHVNGFAVEVRRRQKRGSLFWCRCTSPLHVLLSHVDRLVDITLVPVECMVQTLFTMSWTGFESCALRGPAKEDLRQLNVKNPPLCRLQRRGTEVGRWSPVAPRPGARSWRRRGQHPESKVPHSREITHETAPIDCLDDELVQGVHFDEMVEIGQDLREVALERCVKLQQLARRLGSGAASHGGG